MSFVTSKILKYPIFLVGAERSGTTLLRLMLDHHPQIAFNSEFEYAVDQVEDNGTFPAVDAYCQWLSRQWLFQDAHYKVDPTLDYRQLVESFLLQKLESGGPEKTILGATVHHHFNRLPYLWPHGRYIHIIRDPRDVARSVIGMGWAGNIWVGLDRWIYAENLWSELQKTLDKNSYMEIKYEDLIGDAATGLTRICEFMGVSFSSKMLSYADHSTYERPDPSLVYQWRKKLKDEDIQLVEARVGPMLLERGYEMSGLPSIEVSGERVAHLEHESRINCRKFRIKRYGLPLLILARLTRNLPFGFPKDWFQERLDNIDRKYVK